MYWKRFPGVLRACDDRNDGSGRVPVTDVILNDHTGPCLALLVSESGVQTDIQNRATHAFSRHLEILGVYMLEFFGDLPIESGIGPIAIRQLTHQFPALQEL